MNLTADLTFEQWACILQPDTAFNRVYWYDHTTRSAWNPEPAHNALPFEPKIYWPILWLLGSSHRKYIFCTKALPSIKSLSEALDQSLRKLVWKWAFAAGVFPQTESSDLDRLLKGKRATPRCVHEGVPPEIYAYCNVIRRDVIAAAEQLLLEHRSFAARSWANLPGLAKAACQLIRLGGFCIRQSDKDGGFVIMSKEGLISERSRAMPLTKYDYIHLRQINTLTIHQIHSRLVRRCADFLEMPKLRKQLAAPMPSARSLVNPVVENVKTHKQDGQVKFRIIHSSTNFVYTQLAIFLTAFIKPELDKYSHLVRDTADFIKKISAVRIFRSDILAKGDVSEFFMSGTHVQVASAVFTTFGGDLGRLLESITLFLLDNQFVGLEEDENGTYCRKVSVGSGMGLHCAPDLSNLCFLVTRESNFILLGPRRSEFGIALYLRYMDDLFAVLRRCPRRHMFAAAWSRQGRDVNNPFVLDDWEFDHSRVQFLDLTVEKQENKLAYSPFIKPSSLGVPLTTGSAHPKTVLRTWPLAYNNRLGQNSSSSERYHVAKARFVSRLEASYMCPVVVKSVVDTDAFSDLRRKRRLAFFLAEASAQHSPPPREPVHWVVLPFHPLWAEIGGLARVVRGATQGLEARMLWALANQGAYNTSSSWQLRITWSNEMKHLFLRLRHINN